MKSSFTVSFRTSENSLIDNDLLGAEVSGSDSVQISHLVLGSSLVTDLSNIIMIKPRFTQQ